MTDVQKQHSEPLAILRDVVTDWTRDNRQWHVAPRDAENALRRLEEQLEAAEQKLTDIRAIDRGWPATMTDADKLKEVKRIARSAPAIDSAPDKRGDVPEGNDGIPEPGEIWVSRDPRDNDLRVTVLDVANGYVRIQRFRKTTVGLKRFQRDYEGPVSNQESQP